MEEEIREKIVRGASELIMKYGIRSISMDEISRHLSISKKTLYQYFKDKEELLFQISLEYLKTIKQTFVQASKTAANALEEVVLISACCRKQKQDLNAGTLFEIEKYYPKVYALWKDFHYNYIREYIVRNINNGIKEGLFRPEIKPEIMALMLIFSLEAMSNHSTFSVTKETEAVINEQIFDHYLFGICTDKGRKLYLKYKARLNSELKN